MKILCLLIVLANIFILLWEYRAGAFVDRKASHEQTALASKEQIILWDEQNKQSQPLLSIQNQKGQSDSRKPENISINNITNQPDPSQSQLP